MSKLSAPLIPFKITKEEAEQSIRNELTAKKWFDGKIEKTTLLLKAFYLIDFDLFDTENRNGEEIVSRHSFERLVFNPFLREIDWQKSKLFAEQPALELLSEMEEGIEFKVARSLLATKQIAKIASIAISKEKSIPLEKIIISSTKPFYFPFWVLVVSFGQQKKEIEIDALDGNITKGSIPVREQPAAELAKETITELKEPKNWLSYSKELLIAALMLLKRIQLKKAFKLLWFSLLYKRFFQYLLMFLLLVLLFFLILRVL